MRLSEMADEMPARLQPNSCSSGTMRTLGVARMPAAASSDTKVIAMTTQAKCTRRGAGGVMVAMEFSWAARSHGARRLTVADLKRTLRTGLSHCQPTRWSLHRMAALHEHPA